MLLIVFRSHASLYASQLSSLLTCGNNTSAAASSLSCFGEDVCCLVLHFLKTEIQIEMELSHCCFIIESKQLQVCALKTEEKCILALFHWTWPWCIHLCFPSGRVAFSFHFLLQKPSQEHDVRVYFLIKNLKFKNCKK